MNISRNTMQAVSALIFSVCVAHAASANGWTIKTHVDQMTDKKTIYAIDKAKSQITGVLGAYTPELLMACGTAGNNTELAIALGGTIGGGDITSNNRPVTIRFDKNREFKTQIYLPPQQSNGVYGFNDQSKILRDGIKATRMLVQFTTAYMQTEIADFDISGMRDALNKMHCNLPPPAPRKSANGSYTQSTTPSNKVPVSTPTKSPHVSHSQAAVSSYVRGMPTVRRVLSQVHGKDALDTAARQSGVFEQLINMLSNLEGPRQFSPNQQTTEEIQLRHSYINAENKINSTVQRNLKGKAWTKWYLKMQSYSEDTGYVLNLFFTPQFRSEYKAISQE